MEFRDFICWPAGRSLFHHGRNPIVMEETLLSYFFLGVTFCICFSQLARYQRRHPPMRGVKVLLHVLAVAIMLTINLLITMLLFEPVLEIFDVDRGGFMNFNDLFAAIAIWTAVCLLALVLIGKIKEQLGSYYKTLRMSLIVCGLLPVSLIGVFFVFLFLK